MKKLTPATAMELSLYSGEIKFYPMCLGILRDPVKSLLAAKSKRNMNRTLKVLIEACVIFAIAAGVLVAKTGLLGILLAGSIVTVFLMTLVGFLLFGLVVHIAASTLGGKGKYYEGLTTVAYSMLPVSIGFLVIALLSWAPLTIGIQLIVIAVTLALGISMLHRGVKELYRTDMVTASVAVLISVLVILLSVYISAGMALFNRLAVGML